MTPEHEARRTKLVAEVADHYGRPTDEGIVELALISNDLMWALARLRDHCRQVEDTSAV